MRIRTLLSALAVALVLLPTMPLPAEAQLGDRLRRAREQAANEVADILEGRMRNAIRCQLGDDACVERARADGQETVFVGTDGEVVTDEDGSPIFDQAEAEAAAGYEAPVAASADPTTGEVWRNYDFVPGSKVIYALDLSTERLGRFPARQLEFVHGNGQVIERDGVRALEFSDATKFYVNLPEVLPDDYTIELSFQAAAPNIGLTMAAGEMPGNLGGYDYHYLNLWRGAGIDFKRAGVSNTDSLRIVAEQLVPFKLQVDGDPEAQGERTDYSILYAGTDRIAMVPNATWERTNRIQFNVPANASRPAYLSSIVVAIHGDPLYESLTSGDGVFTTRGILFDTDSDRLRGESTPTLGEIQRTLEQYEDLVLEVEGHTDAQGEDAYNMDLSRRRAQTVVDWLVGKGIEAGRLTAVGKGESEPVADNAAEAGRQQNRRVVLRNTAVAGEQNHPFER